MTGPGSALNLAYNIQLGFRAYSEQSGNPGCLVILQSLDFIGFQPCFGGASDCGNYKQLFSLLGGTALLSSTLMNDPNAVGYSLIANVTDAGLATPTSAERITCNNPDGCVQQSTPSKGAQWSPLLLSNRPISRFETIPNEFAFAKTVKCSPSNLARPSKVAIQR